MADTIRAVKRTTQQQKHEIEESATWLSEMFSENEGKEITWKVIGPGKYGWVVVVLFSNGYSGDVIKCDRCDTTQVVMGDYECLDCQFEKPIQ